MRLSGTKGLLLNLTLDVVIGTVFQRMVTELWNQPFGPDVRI